MSWDATGGGGQWDGDVATTSFNVGPSVNDLGGDATSYGDNAVEVTGGFGGGNRGACFNCGEAGLVS